MAVLIAILGGIAIVTIPVDIFSYIDIPNVSVLYAYNGVSPNDMEKRVLTPFERSLTSNESTMRGFRLCRTRGLC